MELSRSRGELVLSTVGVMRCAHRQSGEFATFQGTAIITALPAQGAVYQTADGSTRGGQITTNQLPATVSEACRVFPSE